MRAALSITLAIAATACGSADLRSAKSTRTAATTVEEESCPDQVSNLIAGQNIDAGDVRISNDDTNLYVEIITQDGWLLTETHIFAGTGDIPVNKKGTPVPGHFPYQHSFNPGVSSHTEVIPLAGLGVDCEGTLKVAVHAVVTRTSGGGTESQTAWGDGEQFNTPRWSFFTLYTGCCDAPPPPEECLVESAEYWAAADPATYPHDLSDWVYCWSPETGGVSVAEIMAMEPTTFFLQLSHEYIAAKQNAVCLGVDCIVGPAISLTNYLTNDCVIDESEQAEAEGYYALFVSYNAGTYDPPVDACW